MKTIDLTQGRVTLIDECDYEILLRYRWHAHREAGRFWYAVRHATIAGRTIHFRMHRVILCAPKGVLVDHINGDTLDNRRKNLRLCGFSENSQNIHVLHGSSGFRGVTWHKKDRRWQASIKANGRSMYLGGYVDKCEAARAYDLAARLYYGPNAAINFPADAESEEPRAWERGRRG